MAHQHTRIYYFSGTGNAMHVAQWIADTARKRDWTAETVNIAGIDRRALPPPEADTMLGFVSPTHGFNLPPIMMYFVFAFPRTAHRNRVFMVNTRAGMKLGTLFLPGLSGVALLLAAAVLSLKGYRIAGMRPIDLPSNWISLHPSLRPKPVIAIYERCRAIATRFAECMTEGRTNYRSLLDLGQDILIAPVSVLYFLVGRFFFAKSFYASADCDNCDTCLKRCPVQAIIPVRGRPFWTFRCESCMRCMNECPRRAIETGHGYITGVIVLSNTLLADLCWNLLSGLAGYSGGGILYWWLRFAIDTLILLGFLTVTYRVMHRLSRLPGVQQLMVYTSLTHYRAWGRYCLAKILKERQRKDHIVEVQPL